MRSKRPITETESYELVQQTTTLQEHLPTAMAVSTVNYMQYDSSPDVWNFDDQEKELSDVELMASFSNSRYETISSGDFIEDNN
ncbi:hypothetical protein T4E_8730 [Trichinella pseudospiralis]|uniref:Uncharacterized protein n=1 Tax=Trichinella pseudospiralis TaxID=6337 RepID=A0A0V0Y5H3_TRIPS|nr:hypothetical protein T4E_8730 [Trichinella pseudospiralis]